MKLAQELNSFQRFSFPLFSCTHFFVRSLPFFWVAYENLIYSNRNVRKEGGNSRLTGRKRLKLAC